MKMVCPVWRRGECHSKICPHVRKHAEIFGEMFGKSGSWCRHQPEAKPCEPCVEAAPAEDHAAAVNPAAQEGGV